MSNKQTLNIIHRYIYGHMAYDSDRKNIRFISIQQIPHDDDRDYEFSSSRKINRIRYDITEKLSMASKIGSPMRSNDEPSLDLPLWLSMINVKNAIDEKIQIMKISKI